MSMRARRLLPVFCPSAWTLAGLAVLFAVPPAHAWDASTTHAGLTERALSASIFHAVLAHRLGRPLGSLEPLRLDASALDVDRARLLKSRLANLDPAGGYRPSADGIATALAWVKAGAVLAKTPPEQGRNHFLEPGKRSGLDDSPGLSGTLHSVRLTFDEGASVRDTATGLTFDLTGMPAIAWVASPRNDLGLSAFWEHWESAVSAVQIGQRDTELAQALLALGGILSVLEDMGQPAFVRNDFRGEFLSHDSGSELERFVADRFGVVALPMSQPPVERPNWTSYFVADDGQGLAQETQKRFFSVGNLPRDFSYDADEVMSDRVASVNRDLAFASPSLAALDLRKQGSTRYVRVEGVRILAYDRHGARVHFFLDRTVHEDTAAYWLPVVGSYAAGLLNHLLRASLDFAVADGKVTVSLKDDAAPVEKATSLRVFVEDAKGERRELAALPISVDAPARFDLPAGSRKIAAIAHGRDSAGDFAAVGETALQF